MSICSSMMYINPTRLCMLSLFSQIYEREKPNGFHQQKLNTKLIRLNAAIVTQLNRSGTKWKREKKNLICSSSLCLSNKSYSTLELKLCEKHLQANSRAVHY